MMSMPKTSGIKSRTDRAPAIEARLDLSSMKRVATPDTRNSSDSRQGLRNSITGSSQVSRCTLLM